MRKYLGVQWIPLTLVIMSISLCSSSYAQDTNFHIYLCFGQSNMEGQGIIEKEDQQANSRFLMMQATDCPDLGRVKDNWYEATPPICRCDTYLSPVDYFGRTMLKNLGDSITVGVINIAVGGCDIRLFDKDIFEDFDSTYVEDWFLKKVAAYEHNPYQFLISMAKKAQKRGVIKGILLHQGETNTGDEQWPSYVDKIYNDLMSDLSLDPSQVPLLAGELVSVENSCCSSMNTIINKLPEIIETAHIISSKDCTAMDKAHFDSAGYRLLGKRYAYKMLSLFK